MKQIAQLKKGVERILKAKEYARNNDTTLTLLVWLNEYPSKIRMCEGQKCIALKDIPLLPQENTIARIRKQFQDEGLYLPTDPKIIKQRKL